MIYVDIHTHKDYSDTGIITVRNIYPGEGFGAFLGTNYYSVGLHPWHIKSIEENEKMLQQVEKAAQFRHVLFIGECGLDKICGTGFKEQERIFTKQLQLAQDINKCVIIHSVKSYDELSGIRKTFTGKLPWIIHSFTGNEQQAHQLSKLGFMFSFGKSLFDGRSKSVTSFKSLPLELIFLETDEYSGSIKDIYKKAAELKGIDVSVLAKGITDNFNRITT